ncbi:hypothetical protein [Streptomyces violens]|uniref:hypothetical protein n=1 Tax=Streptomyces violens TaxID=66377 RepID=UPI0012FF39FA|nr:hypothetical protein [Streptomyces violens]
MTVGAHGILNRHPWLENGDAEEFRETVMDLALVRAEAYDWHAPYGWRTPQGKKLFPDPQRWLECDKGGDWAGGDEVRELAWMRADIPEDVRHSRLPVLPMTRMLFDALERVGEVAFTALCTYLPLQITAGDASSDLDDMREWFSLASPSAPVDVHVTVSAAPNAAWDTPEEPARVLTAVQERLGMAAEARMPSRIDAAHLVRRGTSRELLQGTRPTAQFVVRAREWSPEVSAWLTEATGDALRATGHSSPAVVTVSRASSPVSA